MAARKLLSQLDYEQLAEFRYHLRRFLQFSERAAARRGLSLQQHQALLAIKGMSRENTTIGVLANRLCIRHNTAVELIDRLIAKCLVERRPSSSDRREVLVELTNRAKRILAQMSLAHHNELRKLAPLLRALLKHFARPAIREEPEGPGIGARGWRKKRTRKGRPHSRTRSQSRV
jgi:DNA-binding MarR family transcriptional regulator